MILYTIATTDGALLNYRLGAGGDGDERELKGRARYDENGVHMIRNVDGYNVSTFYPYANIRFVHTTERLAVPWSPDDDE